MNFYGREKELSLLREPNWRDRGELVVVYGRRRIGKTALIEYAFKRNILWKFEGIENGNKKTQIQYFMKQISLYDDKAAKVGDWDTAFTCLAKALGRSSERNRRVVVFFDEFQWMCEMKHLLVSVFKYYWDNFFSKYKNHTFVLCGSISSFIISKVIHSRALYGRVDKEINLQPLTPGECTALFEGKRRTAEILEIHMTFGGIPQYLLELNPRLSLVQNLNELAFKPYGYFFKEYDRLFISHFAANDRYEKILIKLSSGACSSGDIAAYCKLKTGGTLTRLLKELEMAGFIERFTPLNKSRSSKQVLYRIHDEYLHFYFQLILKYSAEIVSGHMPSFQVFNSHEFQRWRGYAFERFCRKNAACIAGALGFSGIVYRYGSWFRRKTSGHSSFQVDLLFDRADKVLTVCECKYVEKLKGREIIETFQRKIDELTDIYPQHFIQKVLIAGKQISIPATISAYFDEVVFAGDVFLPEK